MADPRRKDAFELAVGAISRRERTIAELREWLAARDVEDVEIEETLERLISIGELDDERYATQYAQDKRELRGWGPERIREALVGRGIDRLTAERAAGGERADEQAERAAGLLEARGDELSEAAARNRALGYLSRRGYDLEVSYAAIRLAERRAA